MSAKIPRSRPLQKRRTLGDVISDVLERANRKSQIKFEPRYPVLITYEQKTISLKGKREIYHIFALGIDNATTASRIKQLGNWSGIKQVSGKTIVTYVAKGKDGKAISRHTVSNVLEAFSKNNNNKIGIDQISVPLEDSLHFQKILNSKPPHFQNLKIRNL